MKRKIFDNISANLFIKCITYLFSFITVFYATRVLQPATYGRIAFSSAFTGYFIMLANLGIPNYAMRLCAEKRDNRFELSRTVNEIWSISFLLSVVSSVLLAFSIFTIPKIRENTLLCVIYGSGILFQAFGFEWLYRGLERFRFLAICQLCFKVISLLFILLFVRSEEDVFLYALLSVITAYGSSIACFIAVKRVVDISFRININKKHFRPLVVFFLMSCAVYIYNSLDLTMIGFMKSNYAVGLYSVATKGKSVLILFGGVVWTSILPQATRLWKDGRQDKFKTLAEKSLIIVFIVQFLVTILCMCFSREIVSLIGGDGFIASEDAFRILLLSLVPIGMSNILGGQVLIPSGHEKYLLYAEILGAIINFFTNLCFIPLYSIEGAAATTVLSEVVVCIMCFYYSWKKLQMNFCLEVINKIHKKINKHLKSSRIYFYSQYYADKMPFFCPCCNVRLQRFVDGRFERQAERYNLLRYENSEQNVLCPICGSAPRHRILAVWCSTHRELLRKSRILYFAPEYCMMRWMKRNGIHCVTADLNFDAELRLDIQDTGLPRESYDIIVCNHVLEHVEDFRLALKEVNRILSTGGLFICSFPIDSRVDTVYEDSSIKTDEERLEQFGQVDHKRFFGRNANQLLEEVGFNIEKIYGDDYPEEILPIIGPADYDINVLFHCKKMKSIAS